MKNSITRFLSYSGLVMTVGFLILGLVFPEKFWGTHYLSFLPGNQQITLILITLAALFIPVRTISGLLITNSVNTLPLVISTVYGLTIFLFPMVYDPYGDAVYLEEFNSKVWSEVDFSIQDILTFEMGAWSGRKNVLLIAQSISGAFGISQLTAFRIIGLVCGTLFSFIGSRFILGLFRQSVMGLLIVVGVLASPFALNFFGHSESYAPSLVVLLAWAITLIEFWNSRSWRQLVLLAILSAVSVLFHPMALLLFPAVCISILMKVGILKGEPKTLSLVGWVVLPIFIAGAYLYFFVFGDHIDDRNMQDLVLQYDHLFLPLFSPPPPLNTYNLLSWNHLFDYLNLILLWSPGLVILALATLPFGGTVKSASGEKLLILTVLLYLVLLFMINPLLSMPLDWDLFCLPFPLILVLILLGVNRNINGIPKSVVSLALAVFVFSSSFITLHQSPTAISERLQSLSVHIYSTYYSWTSIVLERSFVPLELPEKNKIDQRKRVIERIRPNAQPKIDYIFAHVLVHQGRSYCIMKDWSNGISLYNEALFYNPDNDAAVDGLMSAYFEMNEFEKAFGYSEKLIQKGFPSKEISLRKAIHCALEARLYQEAYSYSQMYLGLYSSPVIQEVSRRIETSDDLSTLNRLFKSDG